MAHQMALACQRQRRALGKAFGECLWGHVAMESWASVGPCRHGELGVASWASVGSRRAGRLSWASVGPCRH
jgi:hypothetical protein